MPAHHCWVLKVSCLVNRDGGNVLDAISERAARLASSRRVPSRTISAQPLPRRWSMRLIISPYSTPRVPQGNRRGTFRYSTDECLRRSCPPWRLVSPVVHATIFRASRTLARPRVLPATAVGRRVGRTAKGRRECVWSVYRRHSFYRSQDGARKHNARCGLAVR